MEWLPKSTKEILFEIISATNPTKFLSERFSTASSEEDDKLRGIIEELRTKGYIDVMWADNIPYHVGINHTARTYEEQSECFETLSKKRNESDTCNMNSIIFISHRSTDKKIADRILDFLVGTGITKELIFCSSLPGNDINGKISEEVKAALKSSSVNIAILSQDYYQSAYCLNEAGVMWFHDDIPVIAIALPEIHSGNMYGFLSNEYKLRRLDCDNDITYIYDTICAAVSAQQPKVSTVIYETQKLNNRYSDYLTTRELQISSTHTTSLTDITTDDERIVLYYILKTNVRKISKDTVVEWLRKNELYDVNVDNAVYFASARPSIRIK